MTALRFVDTNVLISFWDALIIAAAHKGGATSLLTEDLTHGQQIAGVLVVNPFR